MSDLDNALQSAATLGHYVTIYRPAGHESEWRARVGDTTFIAASFDDLPGLIVKATAREKAKDQQQATL